MPETRRHRKSLPVQDSYIPPPSQFNRGGFKAFASTELLDREPEGLAPASGSIEVVALVELQELVELGHSNDGEQLDWFDEEDLAVQSPEELVEALSLDRSESVRLTFDEIIEQSNAAVDAECTALGLEPLGTHARTSGRRRSLVSLIRGFTS